MKEDRRATVGHMPPELSGDILPLFTRGNCKQITNSAYLWRCFWREACGITCSTHILATN